MSLRAKQDVLPGMHSLSKNNLEGLKLLLGTMSQQEAAVACLQAEGSQPKRQQLKTCPGKAMSVSSLILVIPIQNS